MGRATWGEERECCSGPFSRTAGIEQLMGTGRERGCLLCHRMGVEEAAERVKLSGSRGVALAPLPWAPLPAVLAQLSSTLTGPSHIQQGQSVL